MSFLAAPIKAEQYYTKTSALAYLFPNSEKVSFEKKTLNATQLKKIRSQFKKNKTKANWTVYLATTKGKIDGYAIIDNVIGKESPITFIVSITPEGLIKEVEVMVYRESHGGQIKNKAFRKQFVGKNTSDHIKVGKDIVHVSGATISSKNIATGVKRALLVWEILYKK
jgi:Na+-translocating ferredoxin:NAD+ oxidoreductase subunit G